MTSRFANHRWKFRLLAVGLACLPFVALEVVLRLTSAAATSSDFTSEAQPSVPLFEFDSTTKRYTTSLPYQQYFAETSFDAKSSRPTGSKLAFVLGGSTVQGRPFAPATAFPAWTELLLNQEAAEQWRIVNCGGVSFGSQRLRIILPELLNYEPDLIVIATGHNEFLEDHTYVRAAMQQEGSGLVSGFQHLKTVELFRHWMRPAKNRSATADVPDVNHKLNAKLDNPAGYASYHYDDEWHRHVVRQFKNSLTAMAKACQEKSVPVVLVQLSSNSVDCAPFKSEHVPPLPESQRLAWEQQMSEASVAMDRAEWETASRLLRGCITQSPKFALAHFRLARCLAVQGDTEAAKDEYQLAVDLDVCPLRMKSALMEAIAEVSDSLSVQRVDCDGLFTEQQWENSDSPGFGFDLFLDHVHPNIRGHQAIGWKLASLITQQSHWEQNSPLHAKQTNRIFQNHIESLPANYFVNGRRRIGWLENWARAELGDSELIPFSSFDLQRQTARALELREIDRSRAFVKLMSETPNDLQHLQHLALSFARSGQQEPIRMLTKEVQIDEDDVSDVSAGQQILSPQQRAKGRQILNGEP